MKSLFSALFTIIKGIGRVLAFFRSLVFNLLFFGIIIVVSLSLMRSREPVIPANSILTLTIAGDIVEQKRASDPFGETLDKALGLSEEARDTVLQDVLDVIDHAGDDPNIKAIQLDLESMGLAGLNQLRAIGNALAEVRKKGKPVIAAEDFYSQNQYYLASYAGKIFLNPMGGVYLNGFGVYRLYFREALEKLKINYHVFRVGSFKSALEPFTRNSMSPEDREQSRLWLSALWSSYVSDVSAQRSLPEGAVDAYINRIPENLEAVGGDIARLALDNGLVDELKPRHDIRRYLNGLTGSDPEETVRQVSFSQYLASVPRSHDYQGNEKDTVAIIVAQGTIIPGESKPGTIGSETIAEQLARARTADHIKAVVLRVDSGGGSAFASEMIRQELLELKKSGKPLIVSMGTFAASGAYWISADADEIWASPDTLTGSIGIFMAVPTFEGSLRFAGVHRDGVGTTNLAAGLDLTQPLPPEVAAAIQLTIDHGYRTFLSIVAEGRNIPLDRVEDLAQGKVYDGSAAREAGLVDRIGPLPQAVRSAAERAGLEDYATTILAAPLSFRDRLLHQIGTETGAFFAARSGIASFLGKLLTGESALQDLLLFKDPNSMYAHCMIDSYQN